jgi:hypothetical protein
VREVSVNDDPDDLFLGEFAQRMQQRDEAALEGFAGLRGRGWDEIWSARAD